MDRAHCALSDTQMRWERRRVEGPSGNSGWRRASRYPRAPQTGVNLGQREGCVLTKNILFGMNLLTLVGFLVMGLSLTLHRTGNVGVPLSIALMCAGTALVFYGLFSAD